MLHLNNTTLRGQRSASTSVSPSLSIRSRVSGVKIPRQTSVSNHWKVFGPNAEHSDGDAEYYATSSRLSQQYEWFAPKKSDEEEEEISRENILEMPSADNSFFGMTPKQIATLGLSGTQRNMPDPASLSSKAYMRGEKFSPDQFGYSAANLAGAGANTRIAPTMARGGQSAGGARAASGEYTKYPEGRPVFLPEAERYGNPPDLPSLLLQQRVIYISMPFVSSVTELVVAQCYYLDFDERNRNKPIYIYLNSTGCMNEQNKAISADNEFYAIWASLGLTRAPLYTGVTWKAQNQAAVLLSSGAKGHRYTFPHAKISTAPPVLNRVFGPTVDAQLQANELEYATKYYAAILARATGKTLAVCEKEYLSRKRYFSVKEAFDEGLVDKLVPGYKHNRIRKIIKDKYGDQEKIVRGKPKFKFSREDSQPAAPEAST